MALCCLSATEHPTELALQGLSRGLAFRRSCPTKRPINKHALSASPLNDANLMANLDAGDRVDMKPTEQGGGVESL
jgi:hypothetical protein